MIFPNVGLHRYSKGKMGVGFLLITAIFSFVLGIIIEKTLGKIPAFIIGFGGIFISVFIMVIQVQNAATLGESITIWENYFRGFLEGKFISLLLIDTIAFSVGAFIDSFRG